MKKTAMQEFTEWLEDSKNFVCPKIDSHGLYVDRAQILDKARALCTKERDEYYERLEHVNNMMSISCFGKKLF